MDYGCKMTHKGRTVSEAGGLLRKYRREVGFHRTTVIGIGAGIVAALLSLITFYLQHYR